MRKYLKQGKYSFDENQKIGQGSFGKVFKGYNHQSANWIALKQLQLKKLEEGDDHLKEIVLSEINVMKKFTNNMVSDPCPYLVKQQDCFRTEKYIYIVMQLCEGGTLQDQMDKREQHTKQEVRYIAYCISKGLQYLSKTQIVHRDLKPENIFIFRDSENLQKIYKIGDFGFATHKQKLDVAMGTLLYMAPQMFLPGGYTNKVDIWSFGIITYELMLKKLYFRGKDKWEIVKNIKQKPFCFTEKEKSEISQQCQNFIQLCLIKEAQYRISSQNLFKHPYLQNYRPPLIHKPKPMTSFDKIEVLIQQCQKLREMAQKFSIFSIETSRFTQFIQIYLLKDAYAMMNRIAYTMIYRKDYIGMTAEQFAEIVAAENQQKFNILLDKSKNQSLYISGLFNEKYKQFNRIYVQKFSEQDQKLISKVINEEPYEYANEKVMEKELGKWVDTLREYENWQELYKNCEEVYKLKTQS